MIKKVLLGIIIFSWISMGADAVKELEMAFHKNPYDPENAYNFAKNICLLNDKRCMSAVSYAVALEPELINDAVTFLRELGYDTNPELLRQMAFEHILTTVESELRIYKMERMKEPDKEALQKILNKPPFIYFKNPWTGERITIEDLNSLNF